MSTLKEFFRYNRWADARVFKVCQRADAALLIVDAGGTNGTVLLTLAHLCSTAEGFAALMAAALATAGHAVDAPKFLVTPTGLAEDYGDHELGWYSERTALLDGFFFDLFDGLDDAALDLQVLIPWFGFSLAAREVFMQVLVHAGHHRSTVFSALGAQGVKVPDLDYIVMLAKERAAQ